MTRTGYNAEYAARGVEFTRALANTPWQSREFVVKDCDGRLLAFGASLDSRRSRTPITKDLIGGNVHDTYRIRRSLRRRTRLHLEPVIRLWNVTG